MIRILRANIATLAVDAIVNAANGALLGGGGVDGAIHKAAGPKLLNYCRQLDGCQTGFAKITPGFSLPAQFVIHTVGPIWRGGQQNEAHYLKNCYLESFRIAEENQVRNIAFPAISTGVYGYPSYEAALVATCAMLEHESKFNEIIACCFSHQDVTTYRLALTFG